MYREASFTLFSDTSQFPSDSLAYYRIKLGVQLSNSNWIFSNFSRGKNVLKRDTSLFQNVTVHFLNSKDSIRHIWFNEVLKSEGDSCSLIYVTLNESIDSYKNISSNNLPNQLTIPFQNYVRYQHKKPIISASLSALFPGLGKLYNGRKHSFRFVLLTQSIFGLKLLESNYRLGLTHPYTLFTGGIFLLYYGSSIVGSYEDCKQVKKEQKQIYITHVQDFIINSNSK